jgi:hypothetical protein
MGNAKKTALKDILKEMEFAYNAKLIVVSNALAQHQNVKVVLVH